MQSHQPTDLRSKIRKQLRSRRKQIRIAVLLVTVFLATLAVYAEDPAPAGSEPTRVQSMLSKLQVHGYLSQAYARASDHQFLGIPTEGTSDYREAALQFRYGLTTNDTFVIQIAHERVGQSPVTEEELELDWAFYERRFGPNTSLKVGRVQIPFGIYNEIRDVGTLLPFYRLPNSFYGQQAYSSETIEGGMLMHRFAPESPWSVELSGYGGEWHAAEAREVVKTARINDVLGFQAWLSTPVDGLRIGAGGYRGKHSEGFLPDGVFKPRAVYHASVDGNFERVMARLEYKHSETEDYLLNERTWYAQLGYRFTPKIMATLQVERQSVRIPLPPPIPSFEGNVGRDNAIALDYFFRPDLVFKAELHRNRHIGIEDAVVDLAASTPKADYAIVSLSMSF